MNFSIKGLVEFPWPYEGFVVWDAVGGRVCEVHLPFESKSRQFGSGLITEEDTVPRRQVTRRRLASKL